MGSLFKKRALRAAGLCVCLGIAAAGAQEPGQVSGPIPGVEAAEEYVPPPTDPVEPSAAAPAKAAAAPEEAPAAKMPWELEAAAATEEVPAPIVDEVAQQEIPNKSGARVKPDKAKRVKKERQPREPREAGPLPVRIGARAALGVSAFAGHRALTTSDDVPDALAFVTGSGGKFALRLKPSLSASVGVSAEYDLAEFVDIGIPFAAAADLQYSVYTAYSWARSASADGYDFARFYEAGAELHSFELPVLARFRYDIFYGEVGPQFGWNVFAKAYANSELKRPLLNGFAVGPALGAGADLGVVLVGLRAYIDALEYAKRSKGRPWTLQAGVTAYPF